MEKIKEGDNVMCTVKKIEGTTVFLKIEEDGEGSMALPEVSAGRIRNLRDFVSPGKKVVCKILRIIKGYPELSLRRVTAKEREEVKDKYKKERTLLSMLKTSVKNPKSVLEKIKSEYDILDFFDEVRENPKILEKFVSQKEAQALEKILSEKKEKEKIVKKVLTLRSSSASGLEDIKSILSIENVKIHYLGSSKFSVETSGKDFKSAEHKISEALEEIEKRAKKLKASLKIK